jgi:hypothetical protein
MPLGVEPPDMATEKRPLTPILSLAVRENISAPLRARAAALDSIMIFGLRILLFYIFIDQKQPDKKPL